MKRTHPNIIKDILSVQLAKKSGESVLYGVNDWIPVAEITFRTEQAEEAIKRIKEEVPDMLVGAGTVLTVEQVEQAVKAGAELT